MKLPRGVSGERLVRALEQLGYSVVRQKGSHTRMRHEGATSSFDHCSAAQSVEDRHASRNPLGGCAEEVDDRRCPR
jgi:HicA toxin of bacterial toxin-antitoxin,